ncbi:MAG TPA: acyl-ACP--UDP-N-acetylglucosamine O-acyltransferase [Pirellulaceae bacterium]|nr:acyl-ACP--UDP-N-acetylglucosamine O-acyltransferase [Pirellulaceae bacterium]
MATRISNLASVDPRAEIGEDVSIGPFCVIGPDVRIGDRTVLESNVVVKGRVLIGSGNHVHPGCVLGGEPQDVSYHGARTCVMIGDDNIFRECVTINRATEKEDGITRLGNKCFLMANVHIAHDCKVGDRVIMANGTMLGGHCHVHDFATISGAVAVHHFTSIGSYSFIGGLSRVIHDIPPYMLSEGIPTRPRCVNVVALKRNGFPLATIRALTEAHRLLYRSRVGVENAREILKANGTMVPEVENLFAFIDNQVLGRHGRGRDRRKVA